MRKYVNHLLLLAIMVIGILAIKIQPVYATQPNVTTLRCTGFGDDWLLLNGNLTSYGGTVNVTQYGFDYGTTGSYGTSVETTSSNYTMTAYGYYKYISGLNESTLYYFRANVYNGWWGYGPSMQFSTAGEAVEWPWENNIATVNTTRLVYGPNWAVQRFTTNSTAHTLSSIDLWLQRQNSPGDVSVVLQRAGGDGLPYGSALAIGTIPAQYTGNINPISTNVTTRYNIPLTPTVSLLSNTTYCWTVKALMGDYNNYLLVANVNTGTYPYGTGYVSADNGLTWTDTDTDFIFDLWGRSCLRVDLGQVFSGYRTTGDWLFVFLFDNQYPPYYPALPPNQHFAFQLVNQYNTVIAQTSCEDWGVRPGSIYLSPTTASVLQWQGEYRIRLINIHDGTVYMEYPLQSVDWKSTDLQLLDEWVYAAAQEISDYYNTTLTVAITGRGNVLDPNGSIMFTKGIPYLDTVRPDLFQVVSMTNPIVSTTPTQTMRQAYNWQTMLGPQAVNMLNAWGVMFGGVSGQYIGLMILIVFFVAVAGWGFMPGHTVPATTIAGGIMLVLALVTGLLDMVWGGIMLAISTFFIIYMLWWKNG